jgi:transcriptional regulator with XRE-family HTH domain
MLINTKAIGAKCAYYRKKILGKSQQQVANEVFVDRSLVSNFENGTNTSYIILSWYISNGILETFSLREMGLHYG